MEGCFVRRELRERVEGLVVRRGFSEMVDRSLMRGAAGRVVVGVGRETDVGRAGGITRLVRDGIVDVGLGAGLETGVAPIRGRGPDVDVTAGFKTAFGRLNIGSSKSSSSIISRFQTRRHTTSRPKFSRRGLTRWRRWHCFGRSELP